MRAVLPAGIVRPIRRTHRLWWRGNQGSTSQCVGFAWHGLLRALPHLQRKPDASSIYHEAQKQDEWDGEDYDGTSVRAGAKVLQEAGKLASYIWAFDLETALDWMGSKGPTVWGVNWYQKMFTPDPMTGLVTMSGKLVGGHAVVCLGFDEKKEWLIFQNSWGTDYGLHGRFKMRYADAKRLISEEAEVCAPTEY